MFYRALERKYKLAYGIVFFLSLYLLLLYSGEKIMFFADTLYDAKETWICYLVVGLIISASSLLTKMLLGWIREMRESSRTNASAQGKRQSM